MDSTNESNVSVSIQKIKRGSLIIIGKHRNLTIATDHHFNWFQKKMIKWCFGFTITDYSED